MPKDDLSGKTLDAINLADTNLVDADLRHSSLRHAHLRRAKLARADLSESDLEGADLREADFTDATLRRTNLTQTDLRATNVDQARVVEDVILTDARGVPTELADRVLDQPPQQTATPRPSAPGEGEGSARVPAQAAQERQLTTGEENPA